MKPFICANWKCNFNIEQAQEQMQLLANLSEQHTDLFSKIDLAIAPSAPLLYLFQKTLARSSICLGAQNVFYKSGAYTGEWSIGQIKDLGVRFVLIGHSERRMYFGETDEAVAKKSLACLESDLIPIVCIGESLKQYEQSLSKEVISKQIQVVVETISFHKQKSIVFAYEPIWAIGTGKTPSVDEIIEIHRFIKSKFSTHNRVLYGGSVNPHNAKTLFCPPFVDGFLVGNASLEANTLIQIAASCINHSN